MANQRSSFRELSPALIALVGVLAGSTITVGFQWWKDDRDRDRVEQQARRQAQRLVVNEVREITVQVDLIIENFNLGHTGH
jgi:type II secretory pathway component PulL